MDSQIYIKYRYNIYVHTCIFCTDNLRYMISSFDKENKKVNVYVYMCEYKYTEIIFKVELYR